MCDFYGYLSQVKINNVMDINQIPQKVIRAAWGPQKDGMDWAI
tara:strand:+ start:721 stop:849 length:129 start_codon:yes stop_codon:yes gene_type:complete